jgi:transglutaminase-like putative cysteine protease
VDSLIFVQSENLLEQHTLQWYAESSMSNLYTKEFDQETFTEATALLDYQAPTIVALIKERGWRSITNKTEQIEAIYKMVRDEILYGYTDHFAIPASEVLHLGMGNCLTKTTILLALLRAVGVPCKMQAAMIGRVLHRGLLKGLFLRLSPSTLFHSWVSVWYQDRWINLAGHIVDRPYLDKLQKRYPDYMGSFYGYGIATLNFRNPLVNWEGGQSGIQDRAIQGELGPFHDPDSFFSAHPEAERRTQSLRYRHFLKPILNKNIMRIRER